MWKPEDNQPCFTISAVAKMLKLHPQTLRHYEKAGLIKPHRQGGKSRLYSLADIKKLNKINSLIKDMGVNLAGVEIVLKLMEQMENLQKEFEQKIKEKEKECKEEIERLRRNILNSSS